MDFDLGNQGAAGVIAGAAEGLNNAAKNLFNIQIAKASLARQTKEADADINLKNAQADKMEAEGQITSLQADQMRDFIKKQQKATDAQFDLHDSTISSVEDRVHRAAQGYHGLLSHALQTPEGQQYVQSRITPGAQPAQQGQGQPQPQGGSPVVNSIMPNVGANEETPAMPANPPPQTPPGDIRPITVQGQQQASGASPGAAPAAQPATQNLPALSDVYQGLSTRPFGEDTNDLYMKNPNVMEALKSGNYMVKKDSTMLQSQNPLSLNEKDRTILSDVTDLKKAGYGSNDIFNELTPGTQSLIKTVGEYRATPAQLTSAMGGGRQKQELVKAVQSFYPKWSDAVYDQRHKALIDFTDPNGKNGSAIVAMRQGIEHLGELQKSIDAVSNKNIPGSFGRQIPVLNAPMNMIEQYVGGDPDILALKQNINAVSEEMTKSWGGTNAGEGRLKNWRDTMSATNSPQGWKGLLSKTAKLWQAAADTRSDMFGLALGGQKPEEVLGQGVLLDKHQQILDQVKNAYQPGQKPQPPVSSINVNAFMQKAKAAGYSDQDIQQYLKGKK